jgi:hypothetical protein
LPRSPNSDGHRSPVDALAATSDEDPKIVDSDPVEPSDAYEGQLTRFHQREDLIPRDRKCCGDSSRVHQQRHAVSRGRKVDI